MERGEETGAEISKIMKELKPTIMKGAIKAQKQEMKKRPFLYTTVSFPQKIQTVFGQLMGMNGPQSDWAQVDFDTVK